MAFGGAANQGMPVNGASGAAAGSFAVLRSGADTNARPVAATPIEATGAVYDTTYAGYYRSLVAGKAGCWGTMLPVSLIDAARPLDLRNAAGTLISSHVLPARPAFIRSGNTISMTSTAGATIRYTTNGADPTATSAAYSAATPPVLDAGVWTVKAKAYLNGAAGATRGAIYTVLPAAPVFSLSGNIISMTTTTTAAAIRYTTNGTEPTATSAIYSATTKLPLASGKWTIKAKAYKNGQASATTSAAYTVYLPLITMNAVRADATDSLGRRMISYTTAKASFTRTSQAREIYLRLDLPVAQTREGGLAVYHGLEALRDVVLPGDLLYLKFGGEAPYAGMPATSWTPVSFAAIINRVLGGGTYYFKLVLAGTSSLQPTDPATLGVTLRYNVARFVNQSRGRHGFFRYRQATVDGIPRQGRGRAAGCARWRQPSPQPRIAAGRHRRLGQMRRHRGRGPLLHQPRREREQLAQSQGSDQGEGQSRRPFLGCPGWLRNRLSVRRRQPLHRSRPRTQWRRRLQ